MTQLITPEYAKQQLWLHEHTQYGVASKKYAPLVSQMIERLEVDHLLDYGCGSRLTLLKNIKAARQFKYQAYDPSIPSLSGAPVPAQMVACIDVLEHIEPELLDNVLDDLERLTEGAGFFSVHCGPAEKTLPDGRNAHLIQEPPEWWLPKIMQRFELQTFQRTEDGFYVIVYAKPRLAVEQERKIAHVA